MNGLEVEHLSFRYGAKQALDDVSFEVPQSRFCALLGPNGAGKSTLFALLTRLIVSRQGKIIVAGHDIAREPRAALAKIGVVFQQQTLDLDLTVRRSMRYGAALHGLSGRTAEAAIDAALDKLNLKDRAHELVRSLNGGHRRRVELARALIHAPEVLLLDEPTVGLDAGSRRSITDHVHALADDGLSVLWATHLVDEIMPDDSVVVLHKGKVLSRATAAEIAGERGLGPAFLAMTGEEASA